MNNINKWNKFVNSGKVQDYLNYKGLEIDDKINQVSNDDVFKEGIQNNVNNNERSCYQREASWRK